MESPANTNPATAAATPPTTYVQADAHNFRELVQRLTGAAPGDLPAAVPTRTSPVTVAPRRQAFKLQERRGPSVRKLEIHLGVPSPRSPPPHFHHHLLHHHHHGRGSCNSPIPSPVTPLAWDPLFSLAPASEEKRAIVEKGFYLHPSPRGRGRGSDPPELLPLFPVCSPEQQQQQRNAQPEEE